MRFIPSFPFPWLQRLHDVTRSRRERELLVRLGAVLRGYREQAEMTQETLGHVAGAHPDQRGDFGHRVE